MNSPPSQHRVHGRRGRNNRQLVPSVSEPAALERFCVERGVLELIQVEHTDVEDVVWLHARVDLTCATDSDRAKDALAAELSPFIGRPVRLVSIYRSRRVPEVAGPFTRRVQVYPLSA